MNKITGILIALSHYKVLLSVRVRIYKDSKLKAQIIAKEKAVIISALPGSCTTLPALQNSNAELNQTEKINIDRKIIMNVKQAYNIWTDKYDTDINLTRDLWSSCIERNNW